MFSLYLCAAIGASFGLLGFLTGLWGWGWALTLGVFVFVVAWVVTAILIWRRLGPAMQRVKAQLEGGMVEPALQSLQDLLAFDRWVPMLRRQIHAQIGAIAYQTGDQKRALEHLQQSSVRVADAQAVLACIHYRNGDKQRAFDTLAAAGRKSRKHPLLHNLHAWLLAKEGRRDEAQALLAKFLQRDASNQAAKENLLRLQNGTRLTMDAFGMTWYALRLETPPASYGQVQQVRKGFRTPPKQPKPR